MKTKHFFRLMAAFLLAAVLPISFASCGDDDDTPIENLTPEGRAAVAVDLGLPSGTKWADRNVGASSASDYGGYFAWGETSTKSDYDWSTYLYGSGWGELTKYCTESNCGKDGFTDDKTELELSDDVAHKQWGGSWRMPSKEQFEELINNTTSEFTTVNNVKGYLFTASNGNSIFLPAAGYRDDTSLDDAGSNGNYWSRTLNGTLLAYDLYFYSDGVAVYYSGYGDRNFGLTVRPVRP